jgi:signal transduction histidine kinase
MINRENAIELSELMNNRTTSDPIFIIEMDSRKIRDVNETVISGCDNYNPIGKDIDNIVYIEKNIGSAISPAFFNGQWFNLQQETLIWEGSPHIKISLQQRVGIPDFDTLHSLKKMIGFLLHRLRSPLTGMQGYLSIIEGRTEDETNARHLEKVNKGIEQLFDLLDDLESLQDISLKTVELNNYSANPEPILDEIISGYSEETQDHITFIPSADTQLLRCSPGDLKRILSALIDNALEHAPVNKDNQITIELPSANAVKISHNGNPIPKSIAQQLFFPFVTGKATKLGIGLTMAMLYAKRYKGSIFLTDNSPFRGVSFTFCLPPSLPSASLL